MKPMALSVVVPVRNEEQNLGRCLPALSFADEVVVVDDLSTDRTVGVAAEHGARVVRHEMISFADQRNWAMVHAGLKHPWVLHLDADEVVTPALARELEARVPSASPGVAGFYLARKTMLNDRWLRYSATYPVYVPRVIHRDRARFEAFGHGERLGRVEGDFEYLEEPCLHFNFSKGWADWFDRHNRYSTREAEQIMVDRGAAGVTGCFDRDPVRRRAALRRLSYRLPCRSSLRFVYVFFLRFGFLDGRGGLTYATLQALYETMITLKVREARQRAPGAGA
jgi:glycosyltransferase involved in cell wall biosynthesis